MQTREVGEFLSGALAGAMTKAVLAPLETIRFPLSVFARFPSDTFLLVPCFRFVYKKMLNFRFGFKKMLNFIYFLKKSKILDFFL